jgi:hypothetical protein
MTVDAAGASSMAKAGVTLSAVAPATTATNSGVQTLTFPVSGGSISAVTKIGTIDATGGFKFSGPGGEATFTDPVVDTFPPTTLTASYQGSRKPVFSLSAVAPTTSGNQLTATGSTATLVPATANQLNQRLGVSTFTATTAMGTLAMTLTDKS